MQRAGVSWIRLVLNWYVAEPRHNRYNEEYLRGLEGLIDEIHHTGMQVLVLILATPPWANPAGWDSPPLRSRDLGAFVGYVVRRMSSRVGAWEIWNEPDWGVFWKPAPDAAGFVSMLCDAYRAGKTADPHVTFISGGMAGNDVDYLRQMYALGAEGCFDALGVHPYVFRRSPDAVVPDVRHCFAGLETLHKIMIANGDALKPIWITEMSWATNRRARGASGDWADGVDPETQATYLALAYKKIVDDYPFVKVAIWYDLRDNGTDPTLADDNFGLVRYNFEPKPAYAAFQQLAWSRFGTQALRSRDPSH
jgi:polysaccharide biosynthesis protein PslG